MKIKRSAAAAIAAVLLVACGGGGGGGAPFVGPSSPPGSNQTLAVAPEVDSIGGIAHVALDVVNDPVTGLPSFVFAGQAGVAPTIRVSPGDTIEVDLTDNLAATADMSDQVNLHFHGLTVSPVAPADEVIDTMAQPGQTLHYVVPIPAEQEPGLYWYHPHIHGETDYQVGQSGMSGAIVVQGLQQHIPALASMKEQILIVRDIADTPAEAATAAAFRHADGAPKGGMAGMSDMKMSGSVRTQDDDDGAGSPCRADPEGVHLTVNGTVRPTITIAPGESQFFRVINATGHRHLDLSVDGATLQEVAVDGVALDAYPGTPTTLSKSDIVIPTAGRAEFVVTAPTSGPTEFRTNCFDAGPQGDANPAEILADLNDGLTTSATFHRAPQSLRVGTALPRNLLSEAIPAPVAQRTVRLTEDDNGFYINGQAYDPNAAPMYVVQTGTVEQWTIANYTEEVHDFHMHQVHFYAQQINGQAVAQPQWQDTIVVPPRNDGANGSYTPGTITLLVDFRDPIIRGTFVFHCHILDHEDGGMMAKIQAI